MVQEIVFLVHLLSVPTQQKHAIMVVKIPQDVGMDIGVQKKLAQLAILVEHVKELQNAQQKLNALLNMNLNHPVLTLMELTDGVAGLLVQKDVLVHALGVVVGIVKKLV